MSSRQALSRFIQAPAASFSAVTSVWHRQFASVPQPKDTSIPHSKDGYVMHPDLINEAVKKTQYAVLGELYLRATELEKSGMKITFTNGKHPWTCNSNALLYCCSRIRCGFALELCLSAHPAACTWADSHQIAHRQ